MIGLDDSDVSAIRNLRTRERIARFLYRWWAPMASGMAGFAGGAALVIAAGEKSTEEYTSSYPYAAGMIGLSASCLRSRDQKIIVIALSVVAFAISFIAGVGVGNVVDGGGELGVVTKYGTYS